MGLQKLKNDLSLGAFGMTKAEAHKKGICISCKQKPVAYSEAGIREYSISGLCEKCFDAIVMDREG